MSTDIIETLGSLRTRQKAQPAPLLHTLLLALSIIINCGGIYLLCKENQINHMRVVHELALLKQQLP